MNKKGFTLVELLGVIVILSIIMLIAIPNVTSILEKGKRDNYLVDAKKIITQTEYKIRNSGINKPASSDIYKITLSFLEIDDVKKDPDGNSYSLTDSFVIVVRKNGYLQYYVNLIATTDEGNKGIRLVHEDELNGKNKYSLISKNISIPSDNDIKQITGVLNGHITTY